MCNPIGNSQVHSCQYCIYLTLYFHIYNFFFYTLCRVTSFSPHLSRNRKWAQQAQYNRFVREWVKELG